MNNGKPAYLTLLLALLHGIAGISILAISAWFIAISAIAPVGFNYVIPAVVIRALALLRIASGYASMWFGHNDLLARIAKERLLVFRQLENNQIADKAYTTEALAQHTEELASKWIAWVAPLSSVVFIFSGLCVAAVYLDLPGALYILALLVAWLIAVVVQGLGALTLAKEANKVNKQFRQQSSDFFNRSAIWHLDRSMVESNPASSNTDSTKIPSANQVWHLQLAQKAKAQGTAWWFQGLAFLFVILVMSGISPVVSAFVFAPIAIIIPMVLLAAPDWASAGFLSVSKFAQYKQSVSALKQLKATPIKQYRDREIKHSLNLIQFSAKGRHASMVNTSLAANGVVCISGSSGCGKSSLLQSIIGLLPATGQRAIDGVAMPEGMVTNWRYVEQEPIVLSGSISLNLDPAGNDISQNEMCDLLSALGLEEILPLTTWVGKAGRPLSGGEKKRLALARAILAKPPVLAVDEPFEGLDSHTQQKVSKVLNGLSTTTLILVASHTTPDALNVKTHLQLGEADINTSLQTQCAIS
ncbi:ATP-binding cassette domain-containing protein [Alteromonas sp. BL110]|uniref:ATP-binding cassette domain-containing protein n=1 Tax=Alteromonas sp. BL110 TaxID=1714845 RepID=UPI001E3F5EEE|nr:ATP-binding cassette domain-containing protein [Alteromonas sp. BL110]